jgi:hypothetical protein
MNWENQNPTQERSRARWFDLSVRGLDLWAWIYWESRIILARLGSAEKVAKIGLSRAKTVVAQAEGG